MKTKTTTETREVLTIEGFSRYTISNDGQVMSCVYKKPKLLKGGVNERGYYWVWLSDDNRQQERRTIHRLVASHFVPNPDNKPVVNHIDGDPANNHYTNLEWVTLSENQYHSYRIGLSTPLKGIKHPLAKLTEDDVRKIRSLYVPRKYSEPRLAREFGLNKSTIHAILTRVLWKHI